MRVLCKNLGKGDLLPADIASGHLRSSEFHVTVGREYAVYGLLFTRGALRYLIYEDNSVPLWHPASMFAVVCDRVSRYWRLANWYDSGGYFVVVSFPEITQSPEAFDSLADGERKARRALYERKQLADLEFPNPSIQEVDRSLEGDWLQCPFCADAWHSTSCNALVRCPACQKISKNPRYDAG
jgi:hypothetical protein